MANSTLTLAQLRLRLQHLLADAEARVWSPDTLDEAIRQALNDCGRVLGSKLTLTGLDGAVATSIDARDEELVIRGAAGYAARSRSLDRAERVDLAGGSTTILLDGGRNQLNEFETQLNVLRLRQLQAGTAAPAVTLLWDESHPHW